MTVARLVALLVLAGAPLAGADEGPDGRALYLLHCGRCHGPEGKGNGPDAVTLEVPPGDLSRPGLYVENDAAGLVRGIREGILRNVAVRPLRPPATSPETDEMVRFLERSSVVDWAKVERGRKVYVSRCASCHGEYGAGGGGPSLPSGRAPDADDESRIAHRRTGLPPLEPPVSDEEIGPLAEFVRLLSPGYVTYRRYCESCHGPGRGEAGGLAFEGDWFRRGSREDLRERVWHMMRGANPRMPHFGPVLSEDEARAIVDDLERRATTAFQPWSP